MTAADLIKPGAGENSVAVAQRVALARACQKDRFMQRGHPGITANALCPTALIEEVAAPDRAGRALLHNAAERMKFSARAYHRVLKVARTLADLDGATGVGRMHIAEAISYRLPGDGLAAAA